MKRHENLRQVVGVGFAIAMTIVLLTDTPALSKGAGPMTKLGRGVKNVAVAILDVPATISRASHEDNVWYALTFGVVEGMGSAATRFVSGFIEIITAPFPRYDRPLYDRRLGESPLGRYKR